MTDVPRTRSAPEWLWRTILVAGFFTYGLSVVGVRVPEPVRFHPAVSATLMVVVGILLARSLVPDQSLRFKVMSWVVLLLGLVCGVIAISRVE